MEESTLCHGQRVVIIGFVFICNSLGDVWTLSEVFASWKGRSHYPDHDEIWWALLSVLCGLLEVREMTVL